ncbi:AraC family transcriptional regulator [Actinoplanes sp. G11-F43]|uniref:AraC family transcriptional regulator n=1 Tax=Actinoplanes sp. G11-F43 TaxID=3424130 RepID=UPI003D34BE4C
MDPLEDVLALVGASSSLSAGLVAGGDWALSFEPPDTVKFNALRYGHCRLAVDGAEPIALRPGDCFLLVEPRPFVLASAPGLTPVPAGPYFADAHDGVARVGDGADTYLIGGRFDFGDRARELLLDALPPVVHVPGDSGAAATLRWALDQIDAETRQPAIGSGLVAEHLAMVMLIHILRRHLDHRPAGTGWLAGLSDPVVGTALRVMHARPADPWTVAGLAREASVSRSLLAARFRQVVGRGPLEYLTGWRIELAAAHLRRGEDTMATIARSVGYGSESALSNAFKRVTGASPRAYRRAAPPI